MDVVVILERAGALTGVMAVPNAPDFDAPIPCVIGRSGLMGAGGKREGDGATPDAVLPFRRVLYRADRFARPDTALPVRAIAADDGWCDAPGDRGYNRPVRTPYPASHEVLRRDDGRYDVIVVLGWNDDPPALCDDGCGRGSAIFLHCAERLDGAPAQPGDAAQTLKPTEGCVAIARESLAALLRHVPAGGGRLRFDVR